MINFYKRILFLMERQRISYRSLSEITDIPHATLQRYATGATTKIPEQRVQLIASALHTSPAYLRGYVDDPDYEFSYSDKNLFLRNFEIEEEKSHPGFSQQRKICGHPFKDVFEQPEQLTLDEACRLADNINVPFGQLIDSSKRTVSWTNKYGQEAMDEHVDIVNRICSSGVSALNAPESKIFDEQILPRRIRIVTEYLKDSQPTLEKLMSSVKTLDDK